MAHYSSEGHRALAAHLRAGVTEVELAEHAGINRKTFHTYIHGSRAPGAENRQKMLAVFGVPCVAWDRKPEVASTSLEPVLTDEADTAPTDDAEVQGAIEALTAADEGGELPAAGTLLKIETDKGPDVIEVSHSLEGLLQLRRIALADLRVTKTARERSSLIGALVRIQNRIAQTENEIVARQEAAFSSPLFHEWFNAFWATLEPFPEAEESVRKFCELREAKLGRVAK